MEDYSFTEKEKGAIQSFLEHLVFIEVVRDMFGVLYERTSHVYVLSETANEFFGYLNRVLIDYLNLAYARILDPYDAKHSNFSIEYLHSLQSWHAPEDSQLGELKNKILSFRKYVHKPRNKLLAHNNLKTYLRKEVRLGGFPEGEDRAFIKNVEKYLDIIYQKAFGETFGDIITTNPGDSLDLVRFLQ